MTIKIINDDCKKVELPSNHYDTLITDPPYGLKFMGKDWDRGIPGVAFWKKFLVACKPGAFALVFGGTRTFHRLTCAMEDAGWEIRDCMSWIYGSGFPKSHNISKAIDKAKGAEREVVRQKIRGDVEKAKSSGVTMAAADANKNNKAIFGYGTENITAPATDLAKQWNGYGTALKPAWEPIIVAMKPLDGTFAQNAEKWGVGGLWIDGGRIGYQSEDDKNSATPQGKCTNKVGALAGKTQHNGNRTKFERPEQKGRWPANLLFDEEAAELLDEQSGGASRFFYCAKASRSERNEGLEGMEEQITDDGREKKIDNAYLRGKTLRQNNHPTVKPLKLMEYLCRLTMPPQGGVVLDPFGGSGTTALACKNVGRDCTIVEKDPAYCEIIKARVGVKIVERQEKPGPPVGMRQKIIAAANRRIQKRKTS